MRLVAVAALIGLAAACSVGNASESQPLVAKLEAEIPEVVSRGTSPSVQVAVLNGGQVIWSRGFGRDPGVDSVYMNGSVQKVFEAVAILQLVEQGLVDLDADVATYLPFVVRHPTHPDEWITIRMLLSHRSGLGVAPYQFDWATASTFSPEYRPACPPELLELSLDQFLIASLTPEGSNYDAGIWAHEPGRRYHYGLIGAPLLRYIIEQASGQSFPDYMQQHIFKPLGLTSAGYNAESFAGRNTVPHTRIDGENIVLPIWNGNGHMMRTTAEDQARLMLALMGDGRVGDRQLLRPETVELMRTTTSDFRVLFKTSRDLQRSGEGLGLNTFRGGWLGFGGSTPGYQCLWRFHPSRQVGYVVLCNVNAILGGGHNYVSARNEIYEVQDALLAVLDPTLALRSRAGEATIVAVIALVWGVIFRIFWRRRRSR